MAVWPFLMGLAGLAFALALLLGLHRVTLGAILGAYLAGRFVKATFDDGGNQIIAFAVIWMCVAGLDAISRQPDTKTVILSGVALCYFAAWLLQSPWVIGSWPFVLSDVLAVVAIFWYTGEAAIVWAGNSADGRGLVRSVGASVNLGYNPRGGVADRSGCDDGQAQK